MKKITAIFLGNVLILFFCCSLAFAQSLPLQEAYNTCLQNCSMNADDCKQCCDHYFEPVTKECQARFLSCLDTTNHDAGVCAFRLQSCGAKTSYSCP